MADAINQARAAVARIAQQNAYEDEDAPRLRFVTVDELLRQPAQAWRILRVIPGRGLIVLWGASGSGKTFAALDMAAAIVRGLPWAGRRTRRGAVAYVAAEGNLRDRLDAYLQHNELDSSCLSGLRVLDSAVNLLDPTADVQPLIAALREVADEAGDIAVVIIDTLNRVMPGGDENSSEDMGMVIAAAKLIERELGCVVLFVHHSGKDEAKGSRGHSSLKAATDAELSVKRNGDIRTITAQKVRDGADGEVLMTFRLRPVDLGAMSDIDPDAEPDERRTSCVVAPAEAVGGSEPVKLSDTAEIALRVLRELGAAGDDRTEESSLHPAGRPRVAIDDWRERFRQKRGVNKADAKAMDTSRQAFGRAVDKLIRLRIVGVHEQRVWLW
ncbi:MAG: helicase RepA family protein [Novosphingobium sp.]